MPYERNEDPIFREELSARAPLIPDDESLFNAVDDKHKLLPDGSVKHSHFSHLEMSVDRGSLCAAAQTASRLSAPIVISIIAELCRRKHLVVAPDPIDGNPAHALIYGKKTGSIRKYLSKAFQLVYQIDGMAATQGAGAAPESATT
jgi:hypothetical protein